MGLKPAQVVDIYTTKEAIRPQQEGYSFEPIGRFAKLQKKLWDWGISKGIITPNTVDHVTVIRFHIDPTDLFNRLFETYEAAFLSSDRLRAVYIGPDTFREIMNTPELQDYHGGPFSLHASGRIGGRQERRLFELPVHIIPHMEGCLVV